MHFAKKKGHGIWNGNGKIIIRPLKNQKRSAHACAEQVYRELQYFVAMPGKKVVGEDGKRQRLQLLKPLSGSAVPGQLTALMGGSGAGKVTRKPDDFEVHPLSRL